MQYWDNTKDMIISDLLRRAILIAALLPLIAMADKSPTKPAPVLAVPVCQEPSSGLGGTSPFDEGKAAFVEDMAARHGFNRDELACVFARVRPVAAVGKLIRPAPPGQPKNWRAYRARFIEPIRIHAGAAFWDMHEEALARAEERYGVPPEIIVGVIGIETTYGRNKGNFRVLDALATLAFDYPRVPKRAARMAFFRNEMEQTLLHAREAGIDPLSLKGSYAGAIGWPQFMPGSIRRFAVDFDGDGKIDLRESPVDAIGSVASFLSMHGWKRGEPTVFRAVVDAACANPLHPFINQGLSAKNTLADLRSACITPGVDLPQDMLFGLVDLQNGLAPTEYWLGTSNFFAITHYNRSYFYAMSVIDLGRAVRTLRNSR